jgi:hypothetical protein
MVRLITVLTSIYHQNVVTTSVIPKAAYAPQH